MTNEAVRWRLNQNDCQNRGYVLDGYPHSFQEASGVFFVQNKKPEPKFIIDEASGEKVPAPDEMDEEALKEFLKPKFQKNIYPDSVILLRGSKDLVASRLEKFLPGKTPEEVKTWHWAPEEQNRRYATWYGNNAISNYRNSENPPMSRFFQENNTELFEVDCDGENFEMFESMRIYIERDGRPYNYLKSVGELNKKREAHLHEEEGQWRDGLRKEQEVKDRQAEEQRKKLEDLAHTRLQ
jgi:adenylate kinase